MRRFGFATFCGLMLLTTAIPQEKSVNPGINDPFKKPDIGDFQKKFEGESREVYANREKIVATCGIKPGMVIADIGAGTGLFTRLFSPAVGEKGQVFAVDISPTFLEHIQRTCREQKLRNVTPVLCSQDSIDLPPNSVDLIYVCDTYHHFEFPHRTLASMHRALKPGGKLVVIDFVRIKGKSSDFVMKHVRAGQEVFEKEIAANGFKKSVEITDLLKENYMVFYTKGSS